MPTTVSFDQFPTKKTGLYDPGLEKDSCGVGIIVDVLGGATHKTRMYMLHCHVGCVMWALSHSSITCFNSQGCFASTGESKSSLCML